MKSIVLLSIVVFWSISTFGQNVVDISKTQKITKKGNKEITTFQEKPLTGVLIENHPNGKPKSWTKMKDGLPDGLWQEWYENGQLKFNAYWLAGKGHRPLGILPRKWSITSRGVLQYGYSNWNPKILLQQRAVKVQVELVKCKETRNLDFL